MNANSVAGVREKPTYFQLTGPTASTSVGTRGTGSAAARLLLDLGWQRGPAQFTPAPLSGGLVIITSFLLMYMSVKTPLLPKGKHRISGTTQAHHPGGCLAYNKVPTDDCGLFSQRSVCDVSSVVTDTCLKPETWTVSSLEAGTLAFFITAKSLRVEGLLTLC